MKTRFLAVLLSVAMVFSAVPSTSVSAAPLELDIADVTGAESTTDEEEAAETKEPTGEDAAEETEETAVAGGTEEATTSVGTAEPVESEAEETTDTEELTSTEVTTVTEESTTTVEELTVEETTTEEMTTEVVVKEQDLVSVKGLAAAQLKEGTNYVIVSKATGMAMTVSGFATGNNATIMQWPLENYESQVWTLDYNDDGYYEIINKHSNKSLNVPWASTEEGVAIVQFNQENSDNSRWLITDEGDDFCRITPKNVNTFSLNIKNASSDRGAEVIQGTYTGAENELWEFVEVAEADIEDNPVITDYVPDARLAIDSYIDKFFYVEDGLGKLRNMPSNGFWTDAEVLEMFVDAYEHLGDEKYLTVAEQFWDGIIDRRGTDWEWNDYNDDVMWMVIASIRLYEYSGDEKHLNAAKENFDMCYNRAWDETLGGGLWWRTDNQTKNACVNSPAVIAAAYIGRLTNDDAYWEKAKQIWQWEYDVLYYPEAKDGHAQGEIMDNMKKDGTPVYWANTGNQGVFAGASILLWEKYGDEVYKQTAKLASDLAATMGDGEEGYLNREANSGDSIGGKGLLGRWLGYYTDVCEDVNEYDDWMMRNACAAWFNRNSDNLMWGAFGRPTIENVEECTEIFQADNPNVTMKNYASWGCHSAVSWILNCTGLTPSVEGNVSEWEVKSLDNKTSMTLELNDAGSLVYSIQQDGVTIVEESPLGMNTNVGDFTTGLTYKTEKMASMNETYDVISGKKDVYTNECRGREYVFTKEGSDVEFSVIVRAYDDGIAFRYGINTGNTGEITIDPNNEITGITVPSGTEVWYMPYENDFMYEKDYVAAAVNDMEVGTRPSMPMLYQTGDKYTLVTEAEKTGTYVGSILELENNRLFRTKFDPDQTGAVKTSAPFTSPWRAFVIGDEATIVNNTMVENLSPAPSDEYDFEDWVEPGVSSWSWVSYYGGQEDPEVHKEFIDLASKMGWQYYILDEKWQPASTVSGSRYNGMWDWFEEVRDYANEKGVKLIAWVNKDDVDTDAEREARFKEWSEAGIVGIKVDFFYDEKQSTLQLHDDIYADAAKYKLLVNVHGSNPPSGEIRTYPNVIAREAIKGQEQGGITANQYTIIPFIRAAVGTADVTEQLNSRDTTKTTMGFQIALSTLVENGIRSLGSKPDEYYSVPAAASYYKNFPATWDDTELIDAEVGEYVDIARKSGDSWYAAGISVEARDVTWKPSFLDSAKQYTAFFYTEVDGQRQALTTKVQKNVTKDTELSFQVQNGGGYAVKLVPQSEAIQSITAFPSTLKVMEHHTKYVEVAITPESLDATDITWDVEDDAIVSITPTGVGAMIKGLKEGATTVTATSAFDTSKKAVVNVTVSKGEYSLAEGWTVINDNANYLLTGENAVTIEAEHGVIDNNVFGYKVASADNWEVEAKISGNLFANYQGGFVGVFDSTNLNNYVGAGRRYHEYSAIDGKRNLFAMMSGNGEFYTPDTKSTDDAYVRLVKNGTTFTGYYRFNENDDWTQIINGKDETVKTITGNFENNNNLYVGFYTGTGGTHNNINITIENFKLNGNIVQIANKNEGVSLEESYAVEFDSAGGSAVAAQMVDEGQKATKPADPARNGYTFLGWYMNGQQYDFNTTVTKDIKLTAKWKTSQTLTFTTYEAEAATLAGAQRNANGNASGGYHVGNIGGNANGSVTFNVELGADGMRTMKVYYCTLNTRSFNVLVNGKVVDTRNYQGTGGWTTICANPVELEIELEAGENTIQFAGVSGADAPNLDRIELELTEGEISGDVLTQVDASFITIEAELGTGDGYTSYAIDENASNGAYRGGLGGQMYGGLTFTIDAEAASMRNIKVYYCTGQERQLGVVVNGNEAAALDCVATGGWGTPCETPAQTPIVLQAGTNTIVLTGVDGEFAPNIDKIEIELTDAEAKDIVMEMIANLPEGLSADSSNEDKTKVTAVEIAYNSLRDKSGITNALDLDDALKAIGEDGLDEIVLDEDTQLRENVKAYVIEAEALELAGGAKIAAVKTASNGYHVGEIGGDNNGTVILNVKVDKAGLGSLAIYYTTAADREINVVVNGETAATLACAGDSWTVPNTEPVSAQIKLEAGENTIQLTGADGAFAPNIDKISIELTEAEAKNLVSALIAKLPDEVTEANKGIVYAVKALYDSLESKSGVTGVNTLNAALEMAKELDSFKAYAKAGYEETSGDFALTVNGQDVDVVTYFDGRYSYAHIAYDGTATFEVKALNGNISTYNISPHSYGITAAVNGDTLTFDLAQANSRYLIMDITAGGQKEQLVIAADPVLDIEAPGEDGKPVINITDRGIVAGENGDGSDNSAIIQSAVNELSNAGGGTLYFPAGWYKFVTIDAKDNVTLYLDDGAFLRGSGDRTEYSWSDSGQNGRQATRRDILIDNVKNFSIIGNGMIDANSCILALPQDADGGTTEVPDIDQGDYYPTGWDDFRKGIVDGNNSDGIRFKGVTFKDATGWTFNINSSSNIDITNVKMLNDYAVVHSDGYDICAGQGVYISDCLGLCGDDVFCPKGNNANRDMKDYLIKDSVAYARGGAGCKIGVQAKSKTYNIEFNNIDVVQGYRGFSISRDEGSGDWSDIRFIDIRAEKIWIESSPTDNGQYRSAAFVIWALQKNNEVGNVSNIEVTNCTIEDCSGLNGIMKGETTSSGKKGTISDVRFTNLVMEGRTITQDNYERKITMSGNVEKDTITFNNTKVLKPAISVYEGEVGAKDGANSAKAEACSAGWLAGNLGNGNTVTLTVWADAAGEYDVNVYHCVNGTRTFYITANGETQQLECKGNSFTAPNMSSIKLNLLEGKNEVTFGNPDGWAPNLDKIEVMEKDFTQINPDLTFFPVEAEAGTLAGGATLVNVEEASNGMHVGNLGGNANGTVTFKVNADTAGLRMIRVYYTTAVDRQLNVTVNNNDAITLDCTGNGSWETPNTQPVTALITLAAGENTIQFSGVDGGDAPNIDRIEIELTTAEAAEFVEALIENLPAEITDENKGIVYAVEKAYDDLPDKEGVEGADKLAEAVEEAESLDNPNPGNPGEGDNPNPDNPGEGDNPNPDNPGEGDNPNPDDPGEDVYSPEELGDVLPEDVPQGGIEAIPNGLWIAGIDEEGYDYTGKAIKPVVRVYDYKTLLTEKKDYTLSYKNNKKAYSLEEGNAEYNAKKVPTITVKGKGNYSGKETVTFKILPLDINKEAFDLDNIAVAYKENKTQKVVPTLLWNGKKLKNKTDFKVTYPDAEKDGAYKYTGVYTIQVEGINNFAGTREVTLEITGYNPISKVSVKGLATQYYTGEEIIPSFTVMHGKNELRPNEDYTVSYEHNKEVGTAYVVLTGIGDYSGQKRVSFKIKGWSIKNANVESGLPKSVDYNGKAHEPECVLQIKIDGTYKTLIKDTDYTVSYAKNTNAGTATITFTGMGGFSGTLKKTFKINKFKLAEDTANLFTVEEGITAVYAKGGSKPKPVVKFNGVTLTEGTDYTLSYKNNKAVNDGNNPDKEPTIIVKGKGSFTGSKSVSFKIVPQDIENLQIAVADKVESSKNNGWKSTPKIVDLDGKTLKAGTDYNKNQIEYTYKVDTKLANGTVRAAGESVQSNDIVPAGTVIAVKVYGMKNYTGDLTGEYRILKKGTDIKKAIVKIEQKIYNGKEITLDKEDIKVTLGGKDLEYGTEFEIVEDSYKNNVKKGKATVTIRGIGDGYGGTKTVKFTIRAKEMKWWEALAEALFG